MKLLISALLIAGFTISSSALSDCCPGDCCKLKANKIAAKEPQNNVLARFNFSSTTVAKKSYSPNEYILKLEKNRKIKIL